MKYKSIAISGQIAAGTSTAAKSAAENLNLKYESAGDFFRKYVLENNIPLYDKEQIPDKLDREIDEKLTSLAKNGGHSIDAHYIGYFTKDDSAVLRILLTCDDEVRFKRAQERTHTHIESVEDIKKREDGLDKKFRKLYADEDHLNPKFFDLTIDTTDKSEEEVGEEIAKKFSNMSSLD